MEEMPGHCQVGQKFADQLKVADYHRAAFGPQKRAFDQSTHPDISVKPTRCCLNLTMPSRVMKRSTTYVECARVYREVGYDGMMMPDHAPQIEGDKSGLAFAFEIGYIQSIIQTVKNEA